MTHTLTYYKDLAERMVNVDAQRDEDFRAYDDIYHFQWDLPGEMGDHDWFYKDVSMDGHDAVETIIKIMTNKEPRHKFLPMLNDVVNRQRANELEQIAKWEFFCANRKRQGKIESDVVKCATLYDEVAVQVIDLDWQIDQIKKNKEKSKVSDRKWVAARQNARFVVNVYNTKSVHTQYSVYGPERVLLRVTRSAADVYAEWGDMAKFLLDKDGNIDQSKTVTYNDMTDFDMRAVWLTEYDDPIIPPTDHGLPFINWVSVIGGSSIEDNNEDKRHPLLYSLHKSGAWETINTLNSLIVTRAITLAIQPVTKEEGSNPESTELDFTEPGGSAKVPAGNTLDVLPALPLDPKTLEARENISARIEKTTVSNILQNGQLPAQAAFASLNLATLTALGAIKPIKSLSEKAISGVVELMMKWAKHTGKDLLGYGYGKEDAGKQYSIPIDEVYPENMYISSELVEDLPIDQAQRATTAQLLVTQLGMSKEDALEMVGVEDPRKEMLIRFKEMLQENRVAAIMEKERGMAQLEVQAKQMEMQMAMQQAQMQQQGGGAQAQAEQQAQAQAQSKAQGAKGQAFNPAQGGISPTTTNPSGMTREQASGQDRTGNRIAGGAM